MSLFVIVGDEITILSFEDRTEYLDCLLNGEGYIDFEKAITKIEQDQTKTISIAGE